MTSQVHEVRSWIAIHGPERAIELVHSNVSGSEATADLLKEIGNLFAELGHDRQAGQLYECALKISPDHAPSISNLASLRFRSEDYQLAAELFAKAIRISPKLEIAHIGLLKTHLAKGNPTAFYQSLGNARNDMPMFECPHLLMAKYFLQIGDNETAESFYRLELEAEPNSVEALIYLAALGKNSDEREAALEYLERARIAAPWIETKRTTYADALALHGKTEEALKSLEAANHADPSNIMIAERLIELLIKRHDYEAALDCLERIGFMTSSLKEKKAIVQARSGNYEEAITELEELIRDEGEKNHNLFLLLAECLLIVERFEECHRWLMKKLAADPTDARALTLTADLYENQGNYNQALSQTLQILNREPTNIQALNVMSRLARKGFVSGEKYLARLLMLKESDSDSDCNIAQLIADFYLDNNNIPEAEMWNEGILEESTLNLEALVRQLRIYAIRGESQRIIERLDNLGELMTEDKLLALRNSCIQILPQEDAREQIDFLELLLSKPLGKSQKVSALFAAADNLHKLRDYQSAAEYYKRANQLKNKMMKSDIVKHTASLKLGFHYATNEYSIRCNKEHNGGQGRNCIFIVGLPRSGSTLLETILSRNPDVHDLGEVKFLSSAVSLGRINQERGGTDIRIRADADVVWKEYNKLARSNLQGKKITTDKMLYNLALTGLIARSMPEAKIIYCSRNPLDNILSLYRQNFLSGNYYTYSLEDAAVYLVRTRQFMSRMLTLFGDKIFSYDYDRLVSKPTEEVPRLIEWLGWKWSDIYLHPEESDRNIMTASIFQARSPIKSTSVGQWRKYESMLEPARKVLDEYQIGY